VAKVVGHTVSPTVTCMARSEVHRIFLLVERFTLIQHKDLCSREGVPGQPPDNGQCAPPACPRRGLPGCGESMYRTGFRGAIGMEDSCE